MANANLFAQYLQPVRSMQDRMAEYDAADLRREQLAGVQRQNRLQELAFQRGEEERAGAQRRAGVLQRLAQESGGDENKYVAGLRSVGLFDEAGKIEENILKRRKTGVEVSSGEADVTAKTFAQRRNELDTAIRDIAMFETPDQAIADIQAKVQGGKLPPEQAQGMVQLIQTNPQWQTKLLRGLMTAKDQLDLDERQATRTQQGQQASAQLAQQLTIEQMQDATARRGQDVSASTTRRGQDLSAADAAARRKADEAKAAQTPTGPAAKVADATEALQLIKDAEKSIKSATGSYIGAGVDMLAQAFGVSTQGAQSAAQLKAIEGMLVSKMPKMSGPQSDKDVALYRQMAGMIGDSTVPNETKIAALNTIKQIQMRYAGMDGQSQTNPLGAASMPGSPRVVDFGSLK